MAVRDALLVLLIDGPAYGFQLHGGLAARTGGRREINVGQTYSTLDRLGAQGLVQSAGATDDGLPLHRLTTAGRAAAAAWLDGADAAGADPWHETIDRVLLALSMPAIDAAPILDGELHRWTTRRDAAREVADGGGASDSVASEPAGLAGAAGLADLAAEADVARASAAIAWLGQVSRADAASLAFAPSAERPRRGRRPARAVREVQVAAP
ncbi:PadR family transcriptional regulator [Agromyces sp. NPDC056523]|uniref:PadR family transcriptional regulator n=1 Tax=Agromyces sp. NPDC056523 TaxID=3345850 RepID=UPI00366F8BFD